MNVWRKQSTRKRNGTTKTYYSARWYGTLRLASGQRKQQPLTLERASSVKFLRRLQVSEDDKRANGTTNYSDNRLRPIAELLDEYKTYLRTSKRNTDWYVVRTLNRCRLLLAASKTKTIADLDVGRITTTLSAWRSRADDPISVATSNHYARAVKSFAGWLQRSKLTPVSVRRITYLQAVVA